MRKITNRIIFGGTLFITSLSVQDACGEVMNAEFKFSADVNDQYVWDGTFDKNGQQNYVSSGNDSFDVTGGFDVVPLDRSGWGGTESDFPYPFQQFNVTGVANEFADGGVYARLGTSVSPGTIFDFPSGGTPRARASMTFTLTSAMSFELMVHGFFFDNDLGSGYFGLQEIGGSDIYTSFDFFDTTPALVASGILEPGEYRFFSNSTGGATGDVSLLVFAPAPGSAAVFLVTGMVVARRRRH